MTIVKAWAAMKAGAALEPFEYELGALGTEEVDVQVDNCGLCHTDLSFIANEPGFITFPLVPGHEITGRIAKVGAVAAAKGLAVGQVVGVGWNKQSCQYCDPCISGAPQLCTRLQGTIIGHHGGFATHVRAHWLWTVPVPDGLAAADAGPLFCAGITVFSPLMEFGLRPVDRVGVFGIGGLGHLALQFCHAWGSHVTAFSSTRSKYKEIIGLGADDVVDSRSPDAWAHLKGKLDLIIVTVAVPLDWHRVLELLSPRGRLHFVGIISEPIPVQVMDLLIPQTSISSSPGGSRTSMDAMLRFAARHRIAPRVEHFPMSRINEAIEHMEAGKANYRIVLDADFG